MIKLLEDNLDAIRKLCETHHVRRLEVFGSASDGRFREGESDVDFIVEFEALEPEDYYEAFFGLLEDLEELLGTRVELVTPKPPDRTNIYFIRDIARTRKVIYEHATEEVPG